MKLINQQTYITVFEKLLFMMVLILSLISLPAQAITALTLYNIETTSDTLDNDLTDTVCADVNGLCSLRAAIQHHNANSNDGVIILPGGTYTLSETGAGEDFAVSGDLDVTIGNLIIRGSTDSTNPTIIEGGTGWDDRIFTAADTSILTLENITLRGGNASGNGGAVWSADTSSLILKNCRITRNQASGNGGGISAQGLLFSIENSRVDNNTSNVDGGGIDARATTTNTIRSSTIDNNTATNRGGGINADSISGTVNIVNTTISSNTALNGGGLNAIQNVSLYNTSITNNTAALGGPGHGGGIYLVNSVSIRNSIPRAIFWESR